MTFLEMLLIIILAVVIIFLVIYFLRGSTGKIAFRRPVESRIDEYLDRRFERTIEEWSLVRKNRLQTFKDERERALDQDEKNIQMLRAFEADMKINLNDLEERLNALESSLATKAQDKR